MHDAGVQENGERLTRLRGAGAVEIPVRIWGERAGRTPVIALHGLQSHSGWFYQSAQHLAAHGIPVYAFDRRGSGVSRAPRGDLRSIDDILEDTSTVIEAAMRNEHARHFHLLGHCFGALPAALYGCLYPRKAQSIVLASPALAVRAKPTWREKLAVLRAAAGAREACLPVPFSEDMLSELPEWVEFARRDALALRGITARAYWAIFRGQLALRRRLSALSVPLLMLLAGGDAINDNAGNRRIFRAVPSTGKRLILYPEARHIIEFSRARSAFFSDMGQWFAAFEHPDRQDRESSEAGGM